MIPTVDRVESLFHVIEACTKLKDPPLAAIVCESGGGRISEEFKKRLRSIQHVSLVNSEKRSSALQRNLLISNWLSNYPDVEFGLFLDDDTIPSIDYASRLLEILQRNPDVGGVSGTTAKQTRFRANSALVKIVARSFCLDGKPGSILRSGINVPIDPNEIEPVEVDWLFGCTMWRRDAIAQSRFPIEWMGYAIGEDVAFSMCVGKRWRLLVDPHAKLYSYIESQARSKWQSSYNELVHRHWIVKNRSDFRMVDTALFYWSVVGVTVYRLFMFMRRPSSITIAELKGTLIWIVSRTKSIEAHQ